LSSTKMPISGKDLNRQVAFGGSHLRPIVFTFQSHLKEYLESLPEGLDAPVREGGSSLSAGHCSRCDAHERALVALALGAHAAHSRHQRAYWTDIRGRHVNNTHVETAKKQVKST